jgi:PAS domain S-box-containing protein
LRATLAQAGRSHHAMLSALEDQKRAELAVRELEERFSTAFRSSPVSMGITSITTNCYVDVNDMFLRSSGFSRDEVIGHASADLELFDDPRDRQRLFAEVSQKGFAYCLEMRFRMKNGDIRSGLISAQMIQLNGEAHLLSTILDVTERREADKRLRASEAKFRCLFDSSRDAIVTMVPPSMSFLDGNPAALAMFGANTIGDLTSRGPADLSPENQPDGRSSIDAAREMNEIAMRTGSVSFEWMHKRIDGLEFPTTVLLTRMELDSGPFLQGTVRDISEQRRIEMELGHVRKLEAVGQLAAGIAHEINTPAQYVGDGVHFLKSAFEGYQRLLREYRRAAEVVEKAGGHEALVRAIEETAEDIDLAYLDTNVPGSLESCLDGVSRISSIVRAMKAFAHPDQREMAPADINQALQTTLTIARNEYKYVAEVMTDLADLPPVQCHVGDLNQVFLNLIVNAAHAIGDVVGKTGRKGQIRIKTSVDSTSVRIDVADTGSGIPEAIRQRVFDPFFTTKETGKGSGQGLAIARSIIVTRHHGSLTFDSEVGKGTNFTIRLPIA